MTAYIDNITIVGTPEEIQEFIELRNPKVSYGTTITTPNQDVFFGASGHGFGVKENDCTFVSDDELNTTLHNNLNN